MDLMPETLVLCPSSTLVNSDLARLQSHFKCAKMFRAKMFRALLLMLV